MKEFLKESLKIFLTIGIVTCFSMVLIMSMLGAAILWTVAPDWVMWTINIIMALFYTLSIVVIRATISVMVNGDY